MSKYSLNEDKEKQKRTIPTIKQLLTPKHPSKIKIMLPVHLPFPDAFYKNQILSPYDVP